MQMIDLCGQGRQSARHRVGDGAADTRIARSKIRIVLDGSSGDRLKRQRIGRSPPEATRSTAARFPGWPRAELEAIAARCVEVLDVAAPALLPLTFIAARHDRCTQSPTISRSTAGTLIRCRELAGDGEASGRARRRALELRRNLP